MDVFGLFDSGDKWTAADLPDLNGVVVVVTGANSGIGLEATRELARRGAHCVLACRNLDKAQAALDDVHGDVAEASLEVIELDVASLASVRLFAEEFSERHGRLDLLVNNAGIMMVPFGQTDDGFERQLGTNHLGHFALTGLLLDTLLATDASRVVNIASLAHRSGRMDFDDLMFERGGYTPMSVYGRSKLANLLFTYELQRRFAAAGADTVAVAAHPGISSTSLGDHLFNQWYLSPMKPLMSLVLQGSDKGALPTLRVATDPTVAGGEYFGPGGFQEQRGHPVRVYSNSASHDVEDAARLWDVSEALTGVRYDALDVD